MAGNQGDNRTPDKKIGEVKYAERNKSQPADTQQHSQMEGPAAYAPRDENEDPVRKPAEKEHALMPGRYVVMTKAEQEKKTGLKGSDKRQGALRDAPGNDYTPEGLQRERKGPSDRNFGRDENLLRFPKIRLHRHSAFPPAV